ncbi:MAG: hypothetical protein IT372_24215 [Polyangiaceae bacterium]|nr:hypothetical protein [Polyangiaceae bacterium]
MVFLGGSVGEPAKPVTSPALYKRDLDASLAQLRWAEHFLQVRWQGPGGGALRERSCRRAGAPVGQGAARA